MKKSTEKAKKEKKEKNGKQEQILPKPDGADSNRVFAPADSAPERIIPEKIAEQEKNGVVERSFAQIKATVSSGISEDAKKMAGNQGEGPQHNLHPKAQEVLNAINKNRTARKALQRLVEEGCSQSVILTNLFYYCGGTAEDRRLGLKAALDFRNRFGWLAARLVEDAKWVEEMLEKCRKYGTTIHGPGFEDLSATLRSFAEMLAILGKMYGAGLRHVRPGDASRRRRRSAEPERENPTAGRTQHLVYLAYYVKGESEQPLAEHYRLLAALVAAVQTQDKRPLPKIADGLRKAVDTFAKRRPRDTKLMAAEAEIEFDEKKPKPQPSTRN